MADNSTLVSLQEVLALRVGKNPRYSLRSLAKQLGVSHPYLSRIISRKRKMSPAIQKKIEKRLRVITGRPDLRLEQKSKMFTPEEAKKFLHWKYFAVLKLIEERGFVSGPAWIARRTGLSETETKDVLEKLKEIGMIVLGPKKKLLRVYDSSSFNFSEMTAKDFSKYFMSYFDRVTNHIQNSDSLDDWAGRVQVISLAAGQIRDAQVIIDQCMKDLKRLGAYTENADQIYLAAFGLTPAATK